MFQYSNIEQLTEGMNGIRQGLTDGIKNSAKSLDLKLGIFADQDNVDSSAKNQKETQVPEKRDEL